MSDAFLSSLIEEDLPLVDLTSRALGLERERGRVEAALKAAGVVAGVEAAARIFTLAGCRAEVTLSSGEELRSGRVFLTATGLADRLHAVYKTAQNVMEWSSGIAGRCRLMAQRAKSASPGVEILVTRKHAPGLKRLSLAAALVGGASIHRTGLSDSILVFDQHRALIGGMDGFVERLPEMRRANPERKLAAEVGSAAEAAILAAAGVDVIQLERLPPSELRLAVQAVKGLNPAIVVLAAGGLDADNAEEVAATGVDGLVTSWPYFGRPADVKMTFSRE
jgi:molybdenum transport protein